MTKYGKLSVQSRGRMWFLCSVYLVGTAQSKNQLATCAAFNLIIQRPCIAGDTLTIALDSTVKVVNVFSNDTKHRFVCLQYGSNGKHLTMRASSSQERECWLIAIAAAMSPSSHPTNGPTSCTGNVSTMLQNFWTSKSQPVFHNAATRGNSSLRRMARENVPAAMQFFLTVGQIITAAT